MIFDYTKPEHKDFDVNNPDHRSACIAGQAGFVGPRWYVLTWKQRIFLGRAVEEQFPGVGYHDLWTKLMWLSRVEREAIRARALIKVKGVTNGEPS